MLGIWVNVFVRLVAKLKHLCKRYANGIKNEMIYDYF